MLRRAAFGGTWATSLISFYKGGYRGGSRKCWTSMHLYCINYVLLVVMYTCRIEENKWLEMEIKVEMV